MSRNHVLPQACKSPCALFRLFRSEGRLTSNTLGLKPYYSPWHVPTDFRRSCEMHNTSTWLSYYQSMVRLAPCAKCAGSQYIVHSFIGLI